MNNYVSLSDNITLPCLIQAEAMNSENTKKGYACAKITNLGLIPASLILSAIDTLIGIGAAVGAATNKKLYNIAVCHLGCSQYLLAIPFENVMKLINSDSWPNIMFFSEEQDSHSFHDVNEMTGAPKRNEPRIKKKGNGFFSNPCLNLAKRAENLSKVDSFIESQILSRASYLLIAVACVVTRIADAVLAVPAVLLAVCTGGQFESLNNLAYRMLQATGIIGDIFFCAIKILNPQAGVSRRPMPAE